jgi:eukaryotic-like serine/threonine-protein kinase
VKKLFFFLKSRFFLKNIILAILILILMLISVLSFIRIYTSHGESLTVPDLSGMTMQEVEDVCKQRHLRFEIQDSVYVKNVPFFTVVEQSPKALSKVKKNRKIYLSISSDEPPKVKLPNLIDVSLRQARVILNNFGLLIGELKYEPDIAQNVVLRIEKDGRRLKPGDMIRKGTAIELVLGDGLSSKKVHVLDVRGLSLDEAIFALSGYGLNLGASLYDENVSDSSEAVIYKQRPMPDPELLIAQGEVVDVWMTSPAHFEKLKINVLRNDTKDSLDNEK